MSEAPHATQESPQIAINPLVLRRSRLPFTISLVSFVALLLLIFAPALIGLLTGRPSNLHFDFGSETTPMILLVAMYLPARALVRHDRRERLCGLQARRRIGREPGEPDPAEQLFPAGAADPEGKTESIDQYVRLCSLSGFTGTFTKLGLTGLPLTTVALTLIFAALALLPTDPESQKSFFDLTKLTLGAFIGSFVQRQVEQRRTPGPKGDESRAPS